MLKNQETWQLRWLVFELLCATHGYGLRKDAHILTVLSLQMLWIYMTSFTKASRINYKTLIVDKGHRHLQSHAFKAANTNIHSFSDSLWTTLATRKSEFAAGRHSQTCLGDPTSAECRTTVWSQGTLQRILFRLHDEPLPSVDDHQTSSWSPHKLPSTSRKALSSHMVYTWRR